MKEQLRAHSRPHSVWVATFFMPPPLNCRIRAQAARSRLLHRFHPNSPGSCKSCAGRNRYNEKTHASLPRSTFRCLRDVHFSRPERYATAFACCPPRPPNIRPSQRRLPILRQPKLLPRPSLGLRRKPPHQPPPARPRRIRRRRPRLTPRPSRRRLPRIRVRWATARSRPRAMTRKKNSPPSSSRSTKSMWCSRLPTSAASS